MKTSTKLIRWASAIVIVGSLVVNFGLVQAEGLVTVCHCIAQEDGDECSNTIAIGQAAVATHIDHGDKVGSCVPAGGF